MYLKDSFAKSYHTLYVGRFEEKFDKLVRDSQCGGVKSRCTEHASHFVRLMVERSIRRKKSASLLFVDMSIAFDSLLREVVLPLRTCGGDMRAALVKHGVKDDLATLIAAR